MFFAISDDGFRSGFTDASQSGLQGWGVGGIQVQAATGCCAATTATGATTGSAAGAAGRRLRTEGAAASTGRCYACVETPMWLRRQHFLSCL